MKYSERANMRAHLKCIYSKAITNYQFVLHLVSIYSHYQYLMWPLLQEPTTHCIIIKVHFNLHTVQRWLLRHPVVSAYCCSSFCPRTLDFRAEIPELSDNPPYLHLASLHTFAFDVNRIQIQSYLCSNFTHVYSCVQSLVMVSYTGRSLWLQSAYVSTEYQNFHRAEHISTQ